MVIVTAKTLGKKTNYVDIETCHQYSQHPARSCAA